MISKPALQIYLTSKTRQFLNGQTLKNKKMQSEKYPTNSSSQSSSFHPLQRVITVANVLLIFLEIFVCLYMQIYVFSPIVFYKW